MPSTKKRKKPSGGGAAKKASTKALALPAPPNPAKRRKGAAAYPAATKRELGPEDDRYVTTLNETSTLAEARGWLYFVLGASDLYDGSGRTKSSSDGALNVTEYLVPYRDVAHWIDLDVDPATVGGGLEASLWRYARSRPVSERRASDGWVDCDAALSVPLVAVLLDFR